MVHEGFPKLTWEAKSNGRHTQKINLVETSNDNIQYDPSSGEKQEEKHLDCG